MKLRTSFYFLISHNCILDSSVALRPPLCNSRLHPGGAPLSLGTTRLTPAFRYADIPNISNICSSSNQHNKQSLLTKTTQLWKLMFMLCAAKQKSNKM